MNSSTNQGNKLTNKSLLLPSLGNTHNNQFYSIPIAITNTIQILAEQQAKLAKQLQLLDTQIQLINRNSQAQPTHTIVNKSLSDENIKELNSLRGDYVQLKSSFLSANSSCCTRLSGCELAINNLTSSLSGMQSSHKRLFEEFNSKLYSLTAENSKRNRLMGSLCDRLIQQNHKQNSTIDNCYKKLQLLQVAMHKLQNNNNNTSNDCPEDMGQREIEGENLFAAASEEKSSSSSAGAVSNLNKDLESLRLQLKSLTSCTAQQLQAAERTMNTAVDSFTTAKAESRANYQAAEEFLLTKSTHFSVQYAEMNNKINQLTNQQQYQYHQIQQFIKQNHNSLQLQIDQIKQLILTQQY
jgi:hypothetical protein